MMINGRGESCAPIGWAGGDIDLLIFVLMPLGGGDAAGGWNEEDWGNIIIDPWCPLGGGGDAAGGCG